MIEINLLTAFVTIAVAFAILAKAADLFVDSAVAIAIRYHIPRLVIGIVLVSLGTTAPELTVSLVSALKGQPEMALGNAIGSVICDDGLALPICAFAAAGAIPVLPGVLLVSGTFLIVIQIVAALFILPDGTLTRSEGLLLISIFAAYLGTLIYRHRRHPEVESAVIAEPIAHRPLWQLLTLFILALAVLIFASDLVVVAATRIARGFGISEAIIAVTLVALGTSIPEIATCFTAALKGEGALAIGNIIGADVLNVCWVAGASALANTLVVDRAQAWVMVPSMVVIVLAMLLMLRCGHRLTKAKGAALLGLYLTYLGISFWRFPPTL